MGKWPRSRQLRRRPAHSGAQPLGAHKGSPSNASTATHSVLQAIAWIAAQVAFLTGFLYYFGWVRTGAIFSHFGIDQSLLKYSSQDYLLRSAGLAFRPVAILLVAFAGICLALFVQRAASARFQVASRWILLGTILVAVGISLLGLVRLFGVATLGSPLLWAIALALGAATAEAAASAGPWAMTSSAGAALRRGLAVGLVILGSFWACAIYAQNTGTKLAAGWAANLQTRPSILIYSSEDLRLTGPGITVKRLASSGYRYHYSGLRLLTYSNERWFLLPVGWDGRPGQTAIVIRDVSTIRVEVSPR